MRSAIARRPFGRRKRAITETPDDPGAAHAAALALLARRDFSSAELRARLAEKGFGPAVIDELIAEFAESRAIDDARYVEHFVAQHAARGQGPARIRQELGSLKIGAELIAEAIAAGADWGQRCREVRVRKFGADLPDSAHERARQGRFLQYRGFSSDHVRFALGSEDL